LPAAHAADEWHWPPVVLVTVAVAALLFGQAFLRLRRRGRSDRADWSRAALCAAGLSLMALALVSPLDAVGEDDLLSAHMLQHVLIGDAAPLLLVLAVRGPLALFLLPRAILKPLASSAPLRAFLRALLRPSVTFSLWGVVFLGWHVPAAYDFALSHQVVHDVEHLLFVFAGTLAWIQLIDPARRARLSRGGRVAFAFGLFVLGQPIMEALLFSSSAVYRPYASQTERLFGLSVLTDQRLAAVVMLVEQLLTLGTFIAVLLWPIARARRGAQSAVAQGPT
jgi:cytochrome c oxidase assembly factor CtaG